MHILSRRIGGTLAASCLAWAAALADDTSRTVGPATATIAHRFVPALFGSGPESLRNLLTCPEPQVPGGRVLTSCKVRVEVDGRVGPTRAFCSGSAGTPMRYRRHMQRVLDGSRFMPARVDGVPVPVQFVVVAYFRDEDGDCAASVLLNSGEVDPEMGLDYIGPQEIRSDGGWYRRVKFRNHWDRQRVWSQKSAPERISVAVSERGVAADGRVESPDPVLFDCAAVARALEASRFIPGFHHGHPRAMRYYESVYTGSDRSSCFPNW